MACIFRSILLLSALAGLSGCGSESFKGFVERGDDWYYDEDFEDEPPGWYKRASNGGTVEFGYNDTANSHDSTLRLRFPGYPNLTSGDNALPAYASEATRLAETHYGRYEFSVNFAQCNNTEEVVNGIFIYKNNGTTDANQNNIDDNSEIDIELQCGESQYLWLSVWTDYEINSNTQVETFRKKTRAINMVNGQIRETPNGGEGSYDTVSAGSLPNGFKIPGFPNSSTYYRLGFEWYPGSVRWFIIHNGKEITLWNMTDASMVPQSTAQIMLNLWHSPTHWSSGNAADYPSGTAEMKVDFVRYEPVE